MTTFVADLFVGNGGVSSLSSSFDAGAANYLRIYVIAEGGVSVSSISFGAQTPTLITSSSTTDILGVYELVSPSAGSQTTTVNFSGASGRCAFYIVSRSGVNTSTPSGTPATNTGTSATASATASSASGELVEGVVHYVGTSVTSDASQTERENQPDWVSTSRTFSAAEKAGAASVTLQWTASSAAWRVVAIPIKPTAAAANVGQSWQQKGAMGAMVSM